MPRLWRWLAWPLAVSVSPAAGPISIFALTGLTGENASPWALFFAPLFLLSFPGMVGYVAALVPVMTIGSLLMAIADRYAPARSKLLWLGVGSVLALPFSLWFPVSVPMTAAAGAACAITFRLMIGLSWSPLKT